jgi:hypothetical protein
VRDISRRHGFIYMKEKTESLLDCALGHFWNILPGMDGCFVAST